MLVYEGLRSCTWSEFSLDVFENSTLIPQSNAGSQCDLTLFTCLLIGSYRFCVVPLLAACYGKSKTPLQRSKLCWTIRRTLKFQFLAERNFIESLLLVHETVLFLVCYLIHCWWPHQYWDWTLGNPSFWVLWSSLSKTIFQQSVCVSGKTPFWKLRILNYSIKPLNIPCENPVWYNPLHYANLG